MPGVYRIETLFSPSGLVHNSGPFEAVEYPPAGTIAESADRYQFVGTEALLRMPQERPQHAPLPCRLHEIDDGHDAPRSWFDRNNYGYGGMLCQAWDQRLIRSTTSVAAVPKVVAFADLGKSVRVIEANKVRYVVYDCAAIGKRQRFQSKSGSKLQGRRLRYSDASPPAKAIKLSLIFIGFIYHDFLKSYHMACPPLTHLRHDRIRPIADTSVHG